MAAPVVAKACPVVLRTIGETAEVLVFRHPLAGMQLVKGTVEPGETAATAALRELVEEAGIAARVVGPLGSSSEIADGQLWHFFQCEADVLPESWVHHAEDDGGHDFAFSWWPLPRAPDATSWHPVFIRALDHVRTALSLPRDSG